MFFLVLDNLIKLDVLFGIIMIIMRNTCYNIKSSKLVKRQTFQIKSQEKIWQINKIWAFVLSSGPIKRPIIL